MHRLVTLQFVTPKLHTAPMRTIGRDAAEILPGDAPSGSELKIVSLQPKQLVCKIKLKMVL